MALDLSKLNPQQQVAAIYIGYFDRAPDPIGSQFWEAAISNPTFSLEGMASDFATQPETLDRYPFFEAPNEDGAFAFISLVYLNLFNRAPDEAGLDFWGEALIGSITGENDLSIGDIILSIIQGAQDGVDGNDRSTVLNKIAAANAWTDAAAAADIDYNNDTDAQASAKLSIEAVTDAEETVDAAKASIDSFFGTSLTLSGADQIDEGVANTFTASLASAATQDVVVTFQLVAGDATAGDQGSSGTNLNDFAISAFNPVAVTIPAGSMSATFDVTSVADDLTELPEGYAVTATAGYTTVGKIVTVLDASPVDDVETFTLTASSPTVTEGDTGTKAMTFIVELDRAPTEATTVNYKTTAGDVVTAAGSITFVAGQTTAQVTVQVNSDDLVDGDDTVEVLFSGDALSESVTATGTVTDDDAAFVFTSSATPSVAEGETAVVTLAGADADGSLSTVAITGGADADAFSLSNNSVAFNAAPDFEAPADADGDNTYNVTVTATDEAGNTTEQEIAVSVTDENDETPVITSGATGSVDENADAATVIYTATATDADAGDTITYSVSGADAADVSIDSASGEVTLNASADFEGKASYSFDVTATDAADNASTQSVTVDVNDVRELLAPADTSVNEGDDVVFDIKGEANTQYAVEITSTNLGEITSESVFVTTDANGDATLTRSTAADRTTEADAQSVSAKIVGLGEDAVSVTVADTSLDNTAPVAEDAAETVDEGSTATGQLTATDPDAEDAGDLTFSTTDTVAGFTLNADGSYTFDASDAAYADLGVGETSVQTITYTVNDNATDAGNGALTDTGELTLTVNSTAEAPQTFTLTETLDAGADFTGTSGDDTFLGIVDGADSTFTLGDELDGSAGSDTLRLISVDAGLDLGIASLTSIENLSLRTSANVGVVDLDGNPFETIVVDGRNNVQTADVRISELANGADITVENIDFNDNDLSLVVAEEDGPVTVTVRLVNIDDADVFDSFDATLELDASGDGSSDDDTVNLFLDGVKNTDGDMDFYTTDAETFNVTVVSDSELEDIGNYYNNDGSDFGPTVVNLMLDADLTVAGFWDLTDTADVETMFNISGAGDLSIADFDDGVSDVTVDGSAATGNLELFGAAGSFVSVMTGSGGDTVEIESATTAVATGAGDDTVIVATNIDVDESDLDGGEGDADVLSVDHSIAEGGTDYSDVIAGFEELAITSGLNGTVDVDNFDGIQTVDVQAALAGDSTITGLATGATVAYSADANMGSVLSVDMTDATEPNTPNDTLNVVFNADLDGGDNNSANLSVDGINVLNVSATDSDNEDEATDQADGYTLNLSNEENVDAINISGDRAVSYTASTEATELNSVDGSAAEGDLSIDLAGFSGTEGIELTAGAGDDALIGTGLSDIIVGGDGADNITGDAPTTIVSAGVPQVSTFTIANADAGDVFSIGSTDVTWTGVEGTDNAAVTLALANAITGEQAITVDASLVATGGTWTVTGAADGSAFVIPDLDTTNLPAAGDEVSVTLSGASFDANERVNYQINGGGVVSVDVANLSLAAATTAVANSLDSQLGISAAVVSTGVINVTGPAGAGNSVTITAGVETNSTENNGIDTEAAEVPATAEVVTITPDTAFDAGIMSVQIGGVSYQVTFDTDLGTTLGNFITLHEAAVEAQLGGTAALAATATALTLTGNADGSDITLGGTAVVDGDFTVTHIDDGSLNGDASGVVTTAGAAAVTVTNNSVSIANAADESADAGTNNQTLTTSTTLGTLEVTAGGQTSDELTGGAGSDTFNFASGDSTEAMMDVITDFEAGAANADFDTLNLTSTNIVADVILANQIDVAANSVDATAATDIGAIIEDGIITLVGADAAEIDTLAEWIDVAEQVLAPAEVGAFEFDGSTYVVEEGANIIELEGTVGIVGVSTTEDSNVLHIA